MKLPIRDEQLVAPSKCGQLMQRSETCMPNICRISGAHIKDRINSLNKSINNCVIIFILHWLLSDSDSLKKKDNTAVNTGFNTAVSTDVNLNLFFQVKEMNVLNMTKRW